MLAIEQVHEEWAEGGAPFPGSAIYKRHTRPAVFQRGLRNSCLLPLSSGQHHSTDLSLYTSVHVAVPVLCFVVSQNYPLDRSSATPLTLCMCTVTVTSSDADRRLRRRWELPPQGACEAEPQRGPLPAHALLLPRATRRPQPSVPRQEGSLRGAPGRGRDGQGGTSRQAG